MIIRSVELAKVCGLSSDFFITGKPEVAFSGRSNVGKSSLLNALVNRKSLARVSEKPGKTATINYYDINHEFYFTDLPGYGYAEVSQKAKEEWGVLIERYLNNSESLSLVLLLLDIRRDPNADDLMMVKWIQKSGKKMIPVLTKTDKLSKTDLTKRIRFFESLFPGISCYLVSSVKKTGITELLDVIQNSL